MAILVNLWDLLYLYRAIVLFEGHASFLGTDGPTRAEAECLCRLIEAWQPMLDSKQQFFAHAISGSPNSDYQEQVGLEVTKADLLLLEHTLRTIIEQGRCFPDNLQVHVGPTHEVVPAITRVLDSIQKVLRTTEK